MVAALAYAGAVYAAVVIVQSALDDPEAQVAGVVVERVAPADTAGAPTAESTLALQARAARAQQSVFRLEAANGASRFRVRGLDRR